MASICVFATIIHTYLEIFLHLYVAVCICTFVPISVCMFKHICIFDNTETENGCQPTLFLIVTKNFMSHIN